MPLRPFSSMLLFALLVGCGKSATDYQKDAQKALDGGDAAKATQLAEDGLKVSGDDKAVSWRLEQVHIDALAKGGRGSELPKELDRLKAAYPAQVTAQFYKALADKLGTAGDKAQIDVLDAGAKAFPTDPTFSDAITKIKGSAGASPEEVERLKALGYL